MTPKEKAESLIHKYRMLLMDDGEEYGQEILVTKLSIDSALICVNEILSHHEDGENDNLYITPIDKIYWLDVREELLKESFKIRWYE